MFRAGDSVIHPGHGGCIIDAVQVRPWQGAEDDFYQLRPIMDEKCQVFVPMDGAETLGLRKVISAEEAQGILDGLPTLQAEWQRDFKKRKEHCAEILKQNDIYALTRVVKAYMCADPKSQTSTTDHMLYNASRKKFVSELALALGKKTSAIEDLIAERIAPLAQLG